MENILLYSNPWELAWRCSRNKCDLEETLSLLKKSLLTNNGSREYFSALEFLRFFKSDAPIDKQVLVSRKVFTQDVVRKLLDKIEPEKVVSSYKENPYISMNIMTIWEYLILAGYSKLVKQMIESLTEIIEELLRKEEYSVYRDLVRGVFYGPLAMLPEKYAVETISKIAETTLPNKLNTLYYKLDLLLMLVTSYSPKTLLENREYVEDIIKLVNDVALINSEIVYKDPDIGYNIANEIGLVMDKLNQLCYETRRMDVCKEIKERTKNVLEEMYKHLGSIVNLLLENISGK